MNTTQVFEKRKIAVAIGIDLAKDHCDVVAYNADNKICFTKGERQKFCVHGIIGARQTGASNEHEHQTQFS